MKAALKLQIAERLAALEALSTVGVVWQPALPNQPAPLVILRLVSDVRGAHHGGDDGLRDARIQCDAYAQTADVAQEIRDAVLDSLHGFRGEVVTGGETIASCFHDSSIEDYDEKARLFRSSCDLRIQYNLSAS